MLVPTASPKFQSYVSINPELGLTLFTVELVKLVIELKQVGVVLKFGRECPHTSNGLVTVSLQEFASVTV